MKYFLTTMMTYRVHRSVSVMALLVVALAFWACDNEVKVNAPEKEVMIVYGILDPDQPVQYIRLTKGFQTEGDALVYARETDLSVRNAVVTLTFPSGIAPNSPLKTVQLTAFDTLKNEGGGFNRAMTLYRTTEKIEPGKRYTLKVQLQDGSSSVFTATTTVPDKPFFLRPDTCTLPSLSCNMDNDGEFGADERRYRIYAFEAQDNQIAYLRTPRNIQGREPVPGDAFEVRVYANFAVNGQPQPEARFGPRLPVRFVSTCPTFPNGTMCYPLGAEVVDFLRSRIPADGSATLDVGPQSQALRIEITALDKELANYILVGNPTFTDFTTQKLEYTNIVNQAGEPQAGIFGGINRSSRFVRPTACFQYKLALNGVQQPNRQCVR